MAPNHGGVGANWAGTYHYRAQGVISARSVDEIAQLVSEGGRIKALGTRHSFNDIADSPGTLVSVRALGGEPIIDEQRRQVTVPAGMSYGSLGRFLQERGWALGNLGSLPHISVVGACSTATHGSGARNQSLAAAVCNIEFIAGRGRRIDLNESDPRFLGSVVALGALGIVTTVTLRIEPTYDMRQDVFLNMPWAELAGIDDIMQSAYSVSLFTRWEGAVDQVWVKSRVQNGVSPSKLSGSEAQPATREMSPTGDPHDNTTTQGGLVGPWNERLPHFHFDGSPSHGDEIQSEYFVARERGLDALRALEQIARTFFPHLIVSELRYIAADEMWLSPAYGRDSLAIHFTWKNEPRIVRELLRSIEIVLRPFKARPHWGKWFSMDAPEISSLYPKFSDFIALVREFDPDGQFNNDYLHRVLGLR
ncbi:MAG TPA: D-arabinono-1,4-lactone oxidase [Acidimicrobiales bacterium]